MYMLHNVVNGRFPFKEWRESSPHNTMQSVVYKCALREMENRIAPAALRAGCWRMLTLPPFARNNKTAMGEFTSMCQRSSSWPARISFSHCKLAPRAGGRTREARRGDVIEQNIFQFSIAF